MRGAVPRCARMDNESWLIYLSKKKFVSRTPRRRATLCADSDNESEVPKLASDLKAPNRTEDSEKFAWRRCECQRFT